MNLEIENQTWRGELERFPPQVSTSLCPTPLLGGSETQAVPGNTADQKDSATLSSEPTIHRISGHLDMFTKAEAAFSAQKEPILWWWTRPRFWGRVKLWDRRSWSTFVKKQKHLASWYDLVPAWTGVVLHVKFWWNLRNLVNFMGTSICSCSLIPKYVLNIIYNFNNCTILLHLTNESSIIAFCIAIAAAADTKQYFADWLLLFLWEQGERYIFYKGRNSKYK